MAGRGRFVDVVSGVLRSLYVMVRLGSIAFTTALGHLLMSGGDRGYLDILKALVAYLVIYRHE